MKHVLIGLVLAATVVSPDPVHFRYERAITATAAGQTCVQLPAEVFAHAAEGLADLRLYRDTTEVPYALPQATAPAATAVELTPLNLGTRGGETVFDVAMPNGSYSDVVLHITRKDYIATVEVSGNQQQGGSDATRLGTYTIFDLTTQRLGSSGVLHLPTSDFRYLYVRIRGPVRPEEITSISTGQQPAADTPYMTVAETSMVTTKSHESVAELTVPAHVPVDRITFVPRSGPAEFSRTVHVRVSREKPVPEHEEDSFVNEPYEVPGTLLRLHRDIDGQRIDDEQLSIEVAADHTAATRWGVTVDNGDDAPLPLKAVQLQMRLHLLCFQAAPGTYRLMYGDAALAPPRYDYATLFRQQKDSLTVLLSAEQPNPSFEPRADDRPFTERHPALLWVALVTAIVLLGGIALRSGFNAKSRPTE